MLNVLINYNLKVQITKVVIVLYNKHLYIVITKQVGKISRENKTNRKFVIILESLKKTKNDIKYINIYI